MGVRRMTSFIYDHEDELSELSHISDCKLIIDGHSLMFYLSRFTHIPVVICQEHEDAASVARFFILRLRKCDIDPYIVFDGPCTLDKREKVTATQEGNVVAMEGMFYGEEDDELKDIRLMPTFSVDTIQSVFQELQVPFCNSIEDADAEIVALANKMQCPVLSEDSDFFIFEVNHGYLPLSKFNWYPCFGDDEPKGFNSIKCLKFHRSFICEKWNVSPAYLPFLSMILGNDWLPIETFSGSFLWHLSRKNDIGHSSKFWRIQSAIKYLSSATQTNCTTDSVIAELMRQVPLENRTIVKRRILECYSLYTELPDISEILHFMQSRYNPEVNISEIRDIDTAIRYGLVHFNAYHICNQGYVNVPSAIVCDIKEDPPHFCCREVRDISIALLFRRFFYGPSRSTFLVAEYDMGEYVDDEKEYYGKRRTLNFFRPFCPCCQKMHCFDIPCTEFLIGTDGIIKGLLGITTDTHYSNKLVSVVKNCFSESFCKRIDTAMLAVLYWYKITEPEPRVVVVLLLAISKYLLETVLKLLCNSQKFGFLQPKSTDDFSTNDRSMSRLGSCDTGVNKEQSLNNDCCLRPCPVVRNCSDNEEDETYLKDSTQNQKISPQKNFSSFTSEITSQEKTNVFGSYEYEDYNKCSKNCTESTERISDIAVISSNLSSEEEKSNLESKFDSVPQNSDGLTSIVEDTIIESQISSTSKDLGSVVIDELVKRGIPGNSRSSLEVNSEKSKKNGIHDSGQTSSDFDVSSKLGSVEEMSGSDKDVPPKITKHTDQRAKSSYQVLRDMLLLQHFEFNNTSSLPTAYYKSKDERTENQFAEKTEKSGNGDTECKRPVDSGDYSYHPKHSVFDVFGPGPPKSETNTQIWWVESTDYPVDMVLLHGIAQWECCLWAVLMLHQSLEFDGMQLGLHRIYGSNMAAHEINARLEKSRILDNMRNENLADCFCRIATVLSGQSAFMDLYKDIFESTIQFLLQF